MSEYLLIQNAVAGKSVAIFPGTLPGNSDHVVTEFGDQYSGLTRRCSTGRYPAA